MARSVFEDIDEDGILDAADRPIEGARFILDRSVRREETDREGSLVLASVDAHRPLDLELSLGSLDDPFLQAREAGLALTVRPGQVIDVDVALTLTGEAEASVVLINGDTPVPVAAVRVEAVDVQGNVVASAMSEYDGYVYLAGMPMGSFAIRIAPEALDKAGGASSPVTVTLGRDAPFARAGELTKNTTDGNL